jgi:hypothetical protein
MNPITLIGDTFVFVGRQWRLILRANWWVILIYLAALIGSSWLSLRLLGLVPQSMSVDLIQAIGTVIALSPEFLTLIVTGVIARRTSEHLGGPGIGEVAAGAFLKPWILISLLVFAALVGFEIVYNRYLEFLAQSGDFEFQGIIFMLRYYASAVVFFIGLYFLIALQSRANGFARAEDTGSSGGWRVYLTAMVAGLLLYMSVATTISQLFLFLPPFGFFWATLDRLQPPYFFLTEIARIGSLMLAPIVYAGFIIVAGNAVRRWRA